MIACLFTMLIWNQRRWTGMTELSTSKLQCWSVISTYHTLGLAKWRIKATSIDLEVFFIIHGRSVGGEIAIYCASPFPGAYIPLISSYYIFRIFLYGAPGFAVQSNIGGRHSVILPPREIWSNVHLRIVLSEFLPSICCMAFYSIGTAPQTILPTTATSNPPDCFW